MDYDADNVLSIYTDGSQFSKPRRQGGFGIVFVWDDEDGNEQAYEHSPLGYRSATVPQMELKAAIEALKLLLRPRPPVPPGSYGSVVIWSDAKYLVDNFGNAKFFWPRNKWRTRDGAPVRNPEMWKELVRLVKRLRKRVDIEWVPGHSTSEGNRAADKLARTSAQIRSDQTLTGADLRRKKSPKRLIQGSVGMHGQPIVIHVHKGEYLRAQRCNSYGYSVVSEESPYYQEGGVIYADRDINLNAGHTYAVRVNDDTNNPWITEVLMEVLPGKEEGDAPPPSD
jgi:ribonuclease HI